MEGTEWRVKGGGWRVEGGEWRVKGGGWRVSGRVPRSAEARSEERDGGSALRRPIALCVGFRVTMMP